ncbi:hypothetical protein BDP55DRAFT_94112 [Colletotrichum godetiae]|uniref:Uncharacterized protein n=1 Tax=Colletotrichum godetiae TaxID=1209918 RepID=A0AAJ0ARC6_9PEZI|nr:uncharacterized protein BDP55DRAFT_94112 [Colletotrichum godetiae]KAK1687526.1 hypothetical protein BDP55DRAFT_94112 [Colletotrichum godetiae]
MTSAGGRGSMFESETIAMFLHLSMASHVVVASRWAKRKPDWFRRAANSRNDLVLGCRRHKLCGKIALWMKTGVKPSEVLGFART